MSCVEALVSSVVAETSSAELEDCSATAPISLMSRRCARCRRRCGRRRRRSRATRSLTASTPSPISWKDASRAGARWRRSPRCAARRGGELGGAAGPAWISSTVAAIWPAALGLLGELAHLLGDDREAAALLAGAGGLDRGVERQEVGLVGDAGDRLDDAADALGHPGELLHDLGDLRRRTRSATPSRRSPRARRSSALLGHGAGARGGVGGVASGGGAVAGGRDDLLGGGAHGLDAAHLLLGAVGDAPAAWAISVTADEACSLVLAMRGDAWATTSEPEAMSRSIAAVCSRMSL